MLLDPYMNLLQGIKSTMFQFSTSVLAFLTDKNPNSYIMGFNITRSSYLLGMDY